MIANSNGAHGTRAGNREVAVVFWIVRCRKALAQLAMIMLVDLEQVFPPYAQSQDGQTVYDVMKSQRFSNLLECGDPQFSRGIDRQNDRFLEFESFGWAGQFSLEHRSDSVL